MYIRELFEVKSHHQTEDFLNWFGGSKIIDKNGAPQILYHGTRQDHFKTFEPSKSGEFGPGIYLTDNPGTADFYASNVASGKHGPNIAPVYCFMANPFVVTKQQWIKSTLNRTPKTVQASLKKKGYDGIIGIGINGVDKQYIAFEPRQVKSAVANIGTYSSSGSLTETLTRAPLYRGVRDINHLHADLTSNTMKGYSKQRVWLDGKRRIDDEDDYQGSHWMSGICMTRDSEYAKQWGSVLLVFDQDKIKQNYRVIPYHWGYSIRGNPVPKREREEFVVLDNKLDTYKMDNADFGFQDDKFRIDPRTFDKPVGELNPLSKYLIGYYIENDDFYCDKAKLEFLLNHPKCLGRYDTERFYKSK